MSVDQERNSKPLEAKRPTSGDLVTQLPRFGCEWLRRGLTVVRQPRIRTRASTHSARAPSRQVIFFPSA
jgi:hypothetical protein